MRNDAAFHDTPAYLVAIARAARLAGDRLIESDARRRLREDWGIALSFPALRADARKPQAPKGTK